MLLTNIEINYKENLINSLNILPPQNDNNCPGHER